MSFLTSVYHQSIAANEKHIRFWEDYLNNLKYLDFNAFSEKLKVPVLVPIGSRILFRGELKHTNEVTVALGADYFTKCSVKQAEVLRQHRIRDAESKLEAFRKEREYLENRVSFSQQNVFENQGQEITEVHTEEEDRVWRQRHAEHVRQWKQQKQNDVTVQNEITDEELWERLDELELQEELENELNKQDSKESTESYFVHEDTVLADPEDFQSNKIDKVATTESKKFDGIIGNNMKLSDQLSDTHKFQQLQKVIDKQIELEEKLQELKNKERSKSKTEEDLIAKLDELEELEELQDEMDRIEDIIDNEDVVSENSEDEACLLQPEGTRRRVTFADEDESKTLNITFHHSIVEPNQEQYDPSKGIQKPSDVYEAFPHLFTETKSILKKTNYQNKHGVVKLPVVVKKLDTIEEICNKENRTIEVKDIVERVDVNENNGKENMQNKRVSLFKQRRLQTKSSIPK